MTAFHVCYKLQMKLSFHLLFTPRFFFFFPSSSDRSTIVAHKSDQTRTRVRSQRRWDETAFNSLTSSELLKNEKKSPSPGKVLLGKTNRWVQQMNPILAHHRSSSAARHRPPITAQSPPNPKHAGASERRPAPPVMEASKAAAQIRLRPSWEKTRCERSWRECDAELWIVLDSLSSLVDKCWEL